MLIAQITDLHIGTRTGKAYQNTKRLRGVFEDIQRVSPRPDMIVITGDLVERGDLKSYNTLRDEVSNIEIPIHFALGNHDDSTAFAANFPRSVFNDSFLQYSLNMPSLRIIVIDTSEPGRHGGAFCAERAKWLKAELALAPKKPTLIAMHHPPTDIGIPWLTTPDEADWARRFANIVKAHDNIVHIICGHIHRPIFKRFAGTTVSVASAVAPQVKLDLSEVDADHPDGRVLLEEERPGYALHHWDGKDITTHNVIIGANPIVYYDQAHAHIIRETLDQN